LKKKDQVIAEKEKLFQDKLSSIQSLQNEVASLQVRSLFTRPSLGIFQSLGIVHCIIFEAFWIT
jgi:hypothetical protein